MVQGHPSEHDRPPALSRAGVPDPGGTRSGSPSAITCGIFVDRPPPERYQRCSAQVAHFTMDEREGMGFRGGGRVQGRSRARQHEQKRVSQRRWPKGARWFRLIDSVAPRGRARQRAGLLNGPSVDSHSPPSHRKAASRARTFLQQGQLDGLIEPPPPVAMSATEELPQTLQRAAAPVAGIQM